MAKSLEVSVAYLSALEHGNRGRPSPVMLFQICQHFNIIWDGGDELKNLARLSAPRMVVDTRGLMPGATELANLFADHIGTLTENKIISVLDHLTLKI